MTSSGERGQIQKERAAISEGGENRKGTRYFSDGGKVLKG